MNASPSRRGSPSPSRQAREQGHGQGQGFSSRTLESPWSSDSQWPLRSAPSTTASRQQLLEGAKKLVSRPSTSAAQLLNNSRGSSRPTSRGSHRLRPHLEELKAPPGIGKYASQFLQALEAHHSHSYEDIKAPVWQRPQNAPVNPFTGQPLYTRSNVPSPQPVQPAPAPLPPVIDARRKSTGLETSTNEAAAKILFGQEAHARFYHRYKHLTTAHRDVVHNADATVVCAPASKAAHIMNDDSLLRPDSPDSVSSEDESHKQPFVVDQGPLVHGRRVSMQFAASTHQLETGPVDPYIIACQKKQLVPEPLAVRQFWSASLNFSHFGLGSHRAEALCSCLMSIPHLYDLNLAENRLDDTSLESVLFALQHRVLQPDEPLESTNPKKTAFALSQDVVTAVKLAHRPSVFSTKTWRNLPSPTRKKLPAPRDVFLTSLNLSYNHIADRASFQLSRLLCDLTALKSLSLAHCDLSDVNGAELVRTLQLSDSITTLDLSHNPLACESAIEIGDLIAGTSSLQSLDVSWSQLGRKGGQYIGKQLATNTTLTMLDMDSSVVAGAAGQAIGWALLRHPAMEHLRLRYNGLDGGAAMMLGSAISSCATLRSLSLDGNPIGRSGARALLRALNRRGIAYAKAQSEPASKAADTPIHCNVEVSLIGCNIKEEDLELFDPAEPGGAYRLELDVPYCQFVLQEIITLATDRAGFFLEEVEYTTPDGEVLPLTMEREPAKGSPEGKPVFVTRNGERFRLPQYGVLSLACRCLRLPATELQAVNANGLDNLVELVCASGLEDNSRLQMVQIMSDDLDITCHQANKLLQLPVIAESDEEEKVGHLARLLTRVVDHTNILTLLDEHLSDDGRKLLQRQLGQMFKLVVRNPTGHYKVDLSNAAERAVALKLMEINGEEKLARKNHCARYKRGNGDTSQNGNWDNLRNVMLNGRPMDVSGSFAGKVPRSGTLELDYVSTTRPPPDAVPLDTAGLRRVCQRLRLVARQHGPAILSGTKRFAKQSRGITFLKKRGMLQSILGTSQRLGQEFNNLNQMSTRSLWKLKTGGSYRGSFRDMSTTITTTVEHQESEVLLVRLREMQGSSKHLLTDSPRRTDSPSLPPLASPRTLLGSPPPLMASSASDGGGEAKAQATTTTTGTSPKHQAVKASQDVLGDDWEDLHVDDEDYDSDEDLWDGFGTIDLASLSPIQRIAELEAERIRVRESIADLNTVFSSVFITARQAASVVALYPSRVPESRISAMCAVFARIIDLCNIDCVLAVLSPEDAQIAVHRLGRLNIMNPLKVEGDYVLNLAIRDERTVASMLVRLAVVEPGENWTNESYEGREGWELPTTWAISVPCTGLLVVTYTSEAPDWQERLALCDYVLCEKDSTS